MNVKNGPDRSPAFCMLPWIGLHNQADGDAFPCCYWSGSSMGTLRRSSPAQLLNADGLKRLRRDMLAAKPSAGCADCYANEAAGRLSLRKWANRRFSADRPLVESTRPDGSLPQPRLRYLHLAFSNHCNFRCRMCFPRWSTSWYPDDAALKRERGEHVPRQATLTPTVAPEDFLRALEPHLPDVQLIRFVGGEPLLAKEHYNLLERLLELKLSRVKLLYDTNLSVLRFQDKDVAALWNRFEDVEVSVSFDATGRRGEYLRKGQDWDEAVKNWSRARRDSPRVRFGVAPTVSLFNALHIPDFHREWIDQGLVAPEAFNLKLLKEPRHYNVQALPPRLKERVAEKFAAHINKYLRPLRRAPGTEGSFIPSVLNFTMVQDYMMAADLSRELPKFRNETMALDKIRGERFPEVFPELAELLQAPRAAGKTEVSAS